MSMKPKSMKEFLRHVELPYELWTAEGKYITTLRSERDRREAMKQYRRVPAPTVTWDTYHDPVPDTEAGRRFVARSRARMGAKR